MAVYKDNERGTWYAMIRYTDEEGKPLSKIKRGFELKRDAIAFEHDFRQSILTPTRKITLDTVFNEYLDTVSHSIAKSTLAAYKRTYKQLSVDLGSMSIKRIKAKDIQDLVNTIKSSSYGWKSKNESIRLLKAILKYANDMHNARFRLGLITNVNKTAKDMTNYETWTDDEFNQFIEYVKNPVYNAYFTLLYKTGLRRGEAMALKDTDLIGNRLTVNKSLRSHKEGIKPTKTISSVRTVLIDETTLEKVKMICGKPFIFGGEYPLSATQIQREFIEAINMSKVKKIRIHDLRHSHATNLINAGANIVAVSKRLGHSDINMTLKVYTHLLESTEKDILKYL